MALNEEKKELAFARSESRTPKEIAILNKRRTMERIKAMAEASKPKSVADNLKEPKEAWARNKRGVTPAEAGYVNAARQANLNAPTLAPSGTDMNPSNPASPMPAPGTEKQQVNESPQTTKPAKPQSAVGTDPEEPQSAAGTGTKKERKNVL